MIIIGGGVSGLAAARRLIELAPEIDVVLFESEPRLGGKILTECSEGFVIEGGADSFLSRKPRGVGLCEELGIAERLRGRRPEHAETFVLHRGDLHRLPEGLTGMIPTNLGALEHSTILSPEGKARLSEELELPPALDAGDESIASFASRRLGPEVYERIIEPLMSGIYAGDGEQLSLLATFPQLREAELTHGGLIKGLLATTGADPAARGYPAFVSFPNGMVELVEGLAGRLSDASVWTEARVVSIERRRFGAGYDVGLEGGNRLAADAVIVTTPAYAAARLVSSIDPDLASVLGSIRYSSCATVALAYRESELSRAPRGYGYVVPRAEGRDALACTVVSNKWEHRAPQGHALLRVYLGRYDRPDVMDWDDSRLLGAALAELKETLDVSASPRLFRIHRWPKSMPQYTLGHLRRVAEIDELLSRHRGLFVAGAAYRGVGIPDCIQSGERAADGALASRR